MKDASTGSAQSLYSFENFEVNEQSGALSKDGDPVRIQYLPFQMLLILLQRAGDLVSKEELRDRLWGEGIFVEVDQNLYVTVAKLRETLADTVRNPRFIQTIPGRGYRFIANVSQRPLPATLTALNEEPANPPEADPLQTASLPEDTSPSEGVIQSVLPAEPSTDQTQLSRHGSLFAAFAVLLLLAGGVFWWYRLHLRPIYRPQDQILLGGFESDSSKQNLVPMLAYAMQLKFQESPFFSLIPLPKVRELMSSPGAAGTDELHLCSQLGGKLLVHGRLLSTEHGYQVQLLASRCEDGKLLATETTQFDSDASVMTAMDLVTEKMRHRMGEPDDTLHRFNVPLTQATTGSLAALQAFTEGEQLLKSGRMLDAIPHFKLATDLDPQFALAYARMGTIYLNAQEQDLGTAYYEKAFQLRDRTTDKERLYIAAHYYTDVTGEYSRALDTYKLWLTVYPNDWGAANNLANLNDLLGHPKEALQYALQAVELGQNSITTRATLAQALLTNRAYDRLASICTDKSAAGNHLVAFHNICLLGAFARGSETEMQDELNWGRGNPQQSVLLDSAALCAFSQGRLSVARTLFLDARTSAKENHLPEMEAVASLDQAAAEGALGFAKTAQALAKDALQVTSADTTSAGNMEVNARAGLAFALAKLPREAQKNAEAAARGHSLNSLLNDAELPAIRAVLALNDARPEAALQALSQTSMDLCAETNFAPPYYRGEALLALNRPGEAIENFNKILENRALIPNSVYLGLARMELGRALQLAGHKDEARKAFDSTAGLWFHADADFPATQTLSQYRHTLR